MRTEAQGLGDWGEREVALKVPCQICHRKKLTPLEDSFPSLDLICKGCGSYLAQVKTVTVAASKVNVRPSLIRGAGWNPLQTQMAIGSMRDLYVVGAIKGEAGHELAWIDRVPGPALLANAHIYEKRIAKIHGGKRLHPMFNIRLGDLPAACLITVFGEPPEA